ncbi:LOW QUALITY PROTEIN: hypothetical protein KUTeg_020720 [Tegillarca granosa]|uniref:Uncharacterized protein n=1 Tax=Tegillarca granosa TaxID=220873 RepID=A0ABQ9E8S2_TEGGR|nr:LOW QUALITY PROTEIN: hypothetical protein KUTeg_020720 [Tegillarca granosa]
MSKMMSSEVEEPVPSEEQQSSQKETEQHEEKQDDTATTEPVQQISEKMDKPKENSELPPEIQDNEEQSKQVTDSDGENKIKEDEKNTEKTETQEKQDNKESSGSRVNTPVERSASRGSETDRKGTEDSASARPKSSGSGEVILTGKGKRKKKAKLSADAHMVTFTVTISMAVPTRLFIILNGEDFKFLFSMMYDKSRLFKKNLHPNYDFLEVGGGVRSVCIYQITSSPPTSRRSPVSKSGMSQIHNILLIIFIIFFHIWTESSISLYLYLFSFITFRFFHIYPSLTFIES